LELDIPGEGKNTFTSLSEDNPTLDDLQRRYIRRILEKTGGKISGPGGATEILGMKRSTLNNRMKKLGLR
jgi:transcriptional regulator with GAF, ATPase, and Fis domain